jgi:hypothetical protein
MTKRLVTDAEAAEMRALYVVRVGSAVAIQQLLDTREELIAVLERMVKLYDSDIARTILAQVKGQGLFDSDRNGYGPESPGYYE